MNLKGYFGIVVDVQDDEHRYRIKATIKGKTDQLTADDLDWYYPFFGINHLPQINDEVFIFIFDDTFEYGFYGPKINLTDNGMVDSEYENYLEIYKRNGIELKFTESKGIEFINKDSKIQIEEKKISSIVEGNHLTIEKDRIEVGVNNLEPTPLGDKTVTAFEDTIEGDDEGFQACMDIFDAIAQASSTPPTAPIKAAVMAMLPIMKAKLAATKNKNLQYVKTIRSKLVFIE